MDVNNLNNVYDAMKCFFEVMESDTRNFNTNCEKYFSKLTLLTMKKNYKLSYLDTKLKMSYDIKNLIMLQYLETIFLGKCS